MMAIPSSSSTPIVCPSCLKQFLISAHSPIRFCPLCGYLFPDKKEEPEEIEIESPKNVFLSNRYQLMENIGKGGMGEVFSAFDTICGRRIALKRIRSDLIDHPQIRHRFLKEAHITCQLMHPAIIPIYSIQATQSMVYYTMPFVEGETLKQIIRKARHREKKGEKLDHLGGSIPALMRIFISVCQAVAYAHAKGVLHRDLKPENIIIGKYGEVLILDWGLAKFIDSPSTDEEFPPYPSIPVPKHAEITRVGKVVGTVAYMAPERALSQPATIQTDIYSLGVILYQLLTLRHPFKRASLEEFRKNISKEEWIDPVLAAPYRDVPRMLARITEKCLSRDLESRYQYVDDLIKDLENYLEGRSEWFHVADLDVKNKDDWEFQEHVLIAEHVTVMHMMEEAEWVNLMISRQSFTGNTRIETSVCLGENSHGIGILLSIPEEDERTYINDGYCLWLASDLHRSTKLLRSNVEVMPAPDIYLKRNRWTRIRVEKIDKSIHLYLDDVLQFSYIAHIPLIGTHVGILSRDADFSMHPLKIFVGSLNLTVNCLAVPDAFLAHGDFTQALSEYRRIAYSFPDRVEGREALFRAGLTFIEQAKRAEDKTPFLDLALQEFEKLHGTPGGPLEYLGKALVYQTLNDTQEEIKCFELAYRRYPHHPLLPILQEQILSRMHAISRQQRIATYQFILLAVRHFFPAAIDTHTKRLLSNLEKHWEALPFIEEDVSAHHSLQMMRYAIPLAFWLAKPYILGEIIQDLLQNEDMSVIELGNAIACLIHLGTLTYAQEKLEEVKQHTKDFPKQPWHALQGMIACHQMPLEKVIEKFLDSTFSCSSFAENRMLLYILDQAIDQQHPELVHLAIESLKHCQFKDDMRLNIDMRRIWAYLLEKNWQKAQEMMYTFPDELLNKDSTLVHFLYGCWLRGTEGHEEAMIHFAGILPATYPRTWTLASHELIGDLSQQGSWIDKAFLWEKRQLYRQISLYYHCAGNLDQSKYFYQLAQQVLHDEIP